MQCLFEKLLSDIRIMVKRTVSAKLPIGVLNVKKNFYHSTSCSTPYLKRNANGSGRAEINEGRATQCKSTRGSARVTAEVQ